MKKQIIFLFFFILTALSLLMHMPHFKKDLISIHVWRQTQTQSNIDNFYEEDFNILNPRRNERADGDGVFRMEFPLMQWLVAGLYKIFGPSILLTRIFMFITGLFSILGMFFLIRQIFKSDIAGMMGAWALSFSPSFFYYTINPLPDNFALALAIWGAFFIFKWIDNDKRTNILLGGLLLSVAALCKLPFILYWIIILAFLSIILIQKRKRLKEILPELIISSTFLVFPLIWYIKVISGWEGNGIVTGILDNTFAWTEIFDYLQHNLISVLPELLINYAALPFFIIGIVKTFTKKTYKKNNFYVFALWGIAILSYFIFEINMIAKIHDYYLFPFYPLIIILIVNGAISLYRNNKKFYKYLVIFVFAILPVTAYIRMHVRWNEDDPGFNKDLLVYKSDLRDAVPEDALCVIGNDISHHIFFYYIHKKGWCFEDDQLSNIKLKEAIKAGAEYLYTDSELILQNPEIQKLLDKHVGKYGTITVWKLKTVE